MAHHQEVEIVCPNCGYTAVENYCARCGQQTHLHKDTFMGLVGHFFEHYFHYDNKFWQTIKALLFSPGKLTVAYWNKQRARYIPPISLYIFISAVYFTLQILLAPYAAKQIKVSTKQSTTRPATTQPALSRLDTAKLSKFERAALKTLDPKIRTAMIEDVTHALPKVYFFMIPFLAWIMCLLFWGREGLYFVDHAIFIIHFHCFVFCVSSGIDIINLVGLWLHMPQMVWQLIIVLLGLIAFIIYVVYFIKASINAYEISVGRAIWSGFVVAFFYSLIIGGSMSYYVYWLLTHKY